MCTLSNDYGEDDDIMGVGRRCHDARQVGTHLSRGGLWSSNHVQIKATPRSEAGIGLRGAGGGTNLEPWREYQVRVSDCRTAKRTWEVANVKRPLKAVAWKIAAGSCVHCNRSDPRVVRPSGDVPLRNAGNVLVMDLWVERDAIRNKLGVHQPG